MPVDPFARICGNLLGRIEQLKAENAQLRARSRSRLLITGGSGYLGQWLLQTFAKSEDLTVAYTFSSNPLTGPLSSQLESFRVDLSNEEEDELQQCLLAFQPHIIIHCAAMSSPGACEKDPERAMQVNSPPGFLPALAALRTSPLVIYISTDQVFDGKSPPYRETDKPNPINAYARSKRALEVSVLCLVTNVSNTPISGVIAFAGGVSAEVAGICGFAK